MPDFIQKTCGNNRTLIVRTARAVTTHDSHTARQCWYVRKAGKPPRRFDGRRQRTQNAAWTLLGASPGIRTITDGDNMGGSRNRNIHGMRLWLWVSKAHQKTIVPARNVNSGQVWERPA